MSETMKYNTKRVNFPSNAVKDVWGSGCVSPHILNFGTIGTLARFTLCKSPQYPENKGWAGPTASPVAASLAMVRSQATTPVS